MRNRLLPFLLLLPLLFASCAKTADSGPPPDQSAELTETDNPRDTSQWIIVENGKTDYTLIRPEEADPDELAAAQIVFKGFQDAYGIRLPFETDFVKPGENPDKKLYGEILVGTTNRYYSGVCSAELGENRFLIAGGPKLQILGRTPALTKLAAEVFVRDYLGEDPLVRTAGEKEIYEAEPIMENITFKNPVCTSGADPWVIRDPDDGKYYYCYSGGNGVCVNEIADLAHITSEGGTKVYTAPENTMYSKEYWAPELHKLDGKWYIYVAADDGDNYHHRMYVLACKGDKPTDRFEMVGKLTDPTDKWAIDGTVARIDGELYFIWSGWEGDENVAQNLYIAHMKSPTEIDSARTMISRPEFIWEKLGGRPTINEGPVALEKDGTVHILYSASGSWSDFYNLGKLTWRGGDPLDAANWTKSKSSVFEKTAACFGPGHCSFTTADDGTTWIVYHGNLVSGTGWGGRSVWTQPISWDGDEPVLGSPVSPKEELTLPIAAYDAGAVKRVD